MENREGREKNAISTVTVRTGPHLALLGIVLICLRSLGGTTLYSWENWDTSSFNLYPRQPFPYICLSRNLHSD